MSQRLSRRQVLATGISATIVGVAGCSSLGGSVSLELDNPYEQVTADLSMINDPAEAVSSLTIDLRERMTSSRGFLVISPNNIRYATQVRTQEDSVNIDLREDCQLLTDCDEPGPEGSYRFGFGNAESHMEHEIGIKITADEIIREY